MLAKPGSCPIRPIAGKPFGSVPLDAPGTTEPFPPPDLPPPEYPPIWTRRSDATDKDVFPF